MAARFVDVEQARAAARRRLPRLVFDFVDGGAGREAAIAANRAAFGRVRLAPRVLRNLPPRDLSLALFGTRHALPFGVSPMGMCNLIHPRADRLLAEAARAHGFPVVLSAAGSSLIADMVRWGGERVWFQLYHQSDEQAEFMRARAEAAGVGVLVLTVDVPVVSRRVRDIANGFTIPFRLGPRQFAQFAARPRWSLTRLAHGIPRPVNFDAFGKAFDRGASRAGADLAFLARLRDRWRGKLVVKGVMHPEDARRIAGLGADAIWVSNHGGRQLDAAPPSLDALRAVRAAVGPDLPLILDSGVRSGEDVVRARACGADFVMMGRPWLYALGAGGAAGLAGMIEVLRGEVDTVLAQIGEPALAGVGAHNLWEEAGDGRG